MIIIKYLLKKKTIVKLLIAGEHGALKSTFEISTFATSLPFCTHNQ